MTDERLTTDCSALCPCCGLCDESVKYIPRCHFAFFSGAFLRSISISGSNVGVVLISVYFKHTSDNNKIYIRLQ